MIKVLLAICCILFAPVLLNAQGKDSLIIKESSGAIVASKGVDTIKAKVDSPRVFSPRKAALYSAVMPGLGQIYNRKYWKVPIVYAAVGIPGYLFFDNKKWYNRVRFALAVAGSPTDPATSDSINSVHPMLVDFVKSRNTSSLMTYRNEFRKNMDYSILFTLVFWGLNVVDATVDAHLKGFNVSDDLTMQVRPAILSTNSVGVSIVLSFKDK